MLRTIVANREGFLRYLLLLLQDMEDLPSIGDLVSAIGGRWTSAGSLDGLPLLEELTRAYSRNPGRLDSVRKLVEQLNATAEGTKSFPMSSWTFGECSILCCRGTRMSADMLDVEASSKA